MTIKDIVVLKKLSGEKPVNFADGRELINHIDPNGHGFPYYRLNPFRDALKELEDKGLIKKEMRNSAPYGYGDDEQYHLTAKALEIIALHKTNDAIREAIREEVGHFDFWRSSSYDRC